MVGCLVAPSAGARNKCVSPDRLQEQIKRVQPERKNMYSLTVLQ